MSSTKDSAYSSPRSIDYNLSSSPFTKPTVNNCLRTLCSITCTACNNTFSDPKVLPCLHSFCSPCLNSINNICPECSAEFIMPTNGPAGLIPDYGIINFIRSLRGNLFCNSCKTDNVPALAKCINCEHFLCQNCVLAHNYMHCFEGHRIIEFPKEFFQDENEIDKEKPFVCLLHINEVVKYFCMTCNGPICQQCINQEHLGHRTELLDNVGEVLLMFMKRTMDEVLGRVDEFHLNLKYGNHSSWWLNSQYNDIHNRINDIYEQYSSLLKEHRDTQITQLDCLYNRIKTSLSNNNDAIQDTLENIFKLSDFYSRVTKYSSASQCLMFKKLFESKQRKLATYKPRSLQCNLTFISDNTDFSKLLYNIYGHVQEANMCEYDYLVESNISPVSLTKNTHLKYDKWSNSALEDLKSISELYPNEEISTIFRPLNSIRSTINRTVITYSWKFGSYGHAEGQFTEPNGVCNNSEGDIIITDTNNNRVQVFDKVGRFKFAFGENSESKDTLHFPNRVAVSETTGDIIVTERSPTHQVQIYNQYGAFIRKFGANILQHPRAVAVDNEGNIIVVECKVMRVIIFDTNGTIIHKFHCLNTLHFPNGVAVNDQHEIFISDNRTHCVVVYDYNGIVLRQIGQEGLTNYPIGVMLSKDGLVIVADNHNNFNLTVFTQDGQLVKALESKVKHAQCYDACISAEGSVVLTSKDYRVYIYLTSF